MDIAISLVKRLLQIGVLTSDDIDEMADGLSGQQAHILRCALIDASLAEMRRAELHSIDGGKASKD